jgi:hypothetical protein
MLRRDAQESHSNKKTNLSSTYPYPKLEEAKVIRKFMKKVLASVFAISTFLGGVAYARSVPDQEVSQRKIAYVADRLDRDAALPIPEWVKCKEYFGELNAIGFEGADLKKADSIMFRESRCFQQAHNSDDPTTINGVKGSLGLFQINLFWISQTTAYPKGFLQTVLNRNIKPKQLLNPELNILAAKAIFDYNQSLGGCGWTAWRGC